MFRSRNLCMPQKFGQLCTKNVVTKPGAKIPDWNNAKPFNKIPGLKPYPLIGNAWDFTFGKYKGLQMPEITRKLATEYGSICKLEGLFGKDRTVMLFNPVDIQLVYRTEGMRPWRKETESFTYFRQNFRQEIFQNCAGVSNSQGADWYDIRSKVNPFLMHPHIVKQYIHCIKEVADDFIDRIIELRDVNNELPDDFLNELNKWALETIARITLDTRLGCLEDGLHPNSDPQKLITCVLQFFQLAYQLEVQPSLWKYISTPTFRRIIKIFHTITDISSKYVDVAAKRMTEETKQSSGPKSILEKLLKIDKSIATVMSMDLIMAGVDTTSTTAALFMYNIAKSQSAQDQLRAEIKLALPSKYSILTSDTLNKIPYLKACMKESARITPITTGNMRRTGKDLVLGGYQVPKGTDVAMCHIIPQLSEMQFPFPDEFIPDRWLPRGNMKCIKPPGREDICIFVTAKDAHPFSCMPFGFGPRMCIGKRFAELEIQILFMQLLRKYRIEWNYGQMEYKSSLINVPAKKLKFKVTEVN